MSTPAPAPAPQAPEILTTSPSGQTTSVQNARPAESSTSAQLGEATPAPATTLAPTSTPAATSVPASTSTPTTATPPNPASAAPPAQNASPLPEEPTYNEQLNAADRLWKFKMALTIALILDGLVGIGCIAWVLDTTGHFVNGFSYGYETELSMPWGLITFSISILWCAYCIARFIFAKRPVHPGFRVTMDLLLWLGFIFTALFAMMTLYNVLYWGDGGELGYSEGFSTTYGHYELQRNNTWTWETSSSSSYYASVTYERDCTRISQYTGYYSSTAPFRNCAEMDAYVNKLWTEKPNFLRVVLTAVVTQWIAVALHFALFVWACVDCHKKRRTKISNDAEKLAASIVQTMVQNGAIIPTNRQMHTRANGWQQAYEPLQSAPNSFSGQGGNAPQGQYPMYPPHMQGQHMQGQRMQGQQMQMHAQQMRGPSGPQMSRQARPVSEDQPLPPLPPRPQTQERAQTQTQDQTQAGPSKGKEPAGGVAASYYEPER